MDAFELSRIQFGALTYFHLLFPAVTMTLGWVLVAFRLRARSGDAARGRVWLRAYRFWLPVFTLTLAMNIVSAAALLFQGDLSFPVFVEQAGPVIRNALWLGAIGVLMQTLGMGVALLPPGRVSQATDLQALILAAAGASLGALWPALLAGWMRNPAMDETGLWALMGNPAVLGLVLHLVLASVVVTGSILASLSAWRILLGDRGDEGTGVLRFGLHLARLGAVAAVGLSLLRFGLWSGQPGAPGVVFGYAVFAAVIGALRRPRNGFGLILTMALPLAGWALLLAGWQVGSTLQGDWLIAGVLRAEQAFAVMAPGTVDTTLPVYLATITALLVSYGAVLLVMARNASLTGGKVASVLERPHLRAQARLPG